MAKQVEGRVWDELGPLTWLPVFRQMVGRRGSVAALAVLSVGTPTAWGVGGTCSDMRQFSLPAGSVESALLEIARQGQCAISFDPALVAGATTAALSGTLTAREALVRTIAGLNVELQATADGLWTLRPRAASVSSDELPIYSLPDISVIGQRAQNAESGEILLPSSGSVTPVDTPLSQIPVSVSTIGAATAERQQSGTLGELLQNASGVSPIFDATHAFTPGVRVRGLGAQGRMIDGMFDTTDYPGPLEGIQRVDVVKGPADATQGDLAGNGVVNIVTKRPAMKARNGLGSQVSDDGRGKISLDLDGLIGGGDKWGYRLDATTQHALRNRGLAVAPAEDYVASSLRYRDSATDWTVGVQHYRQRPAIQPFTVAVKGRPYEGAAPIESSELGEARLNVSTRTYYLLEHQLAPNWRWRSRASWSGYRARYTYFTPEFVEEDEGWAYLDSQQITARRRSTTFANELLWSLRTGPVQQHILIGGDRVSALTKNCLCSPINYGFYDLATGQYESEEPYDAFDEGLYRLSASGIYLQDQIGIGERLNLTGSIRRSRSKLLSKPPWAPWLDGFQASIRSASTSLTFGASYQLTPEVSAYGSVSRGANSIPEGITAAGQGLPPENLRQKEFGLKFDLLDDRLRGSVSQFHLKSDYTNVPDSTTPTAYAILPGQSLRGWEAEFVGQLRHGWDIIFSFTQFKSKTEDGWKIPGQPEHFGRLWTSYAFQDKPLQNWGATFGVTTVSHSYADLDGMVVVPGYSQLDASLFYRTPSLSAELGVKNLENRRNYGPTVSPLRISVLPSRLILLTVKRTL